MADPKDANGAEPIEPRKSLRDIAEDAYDEVTQEDIIDPESDEPVSNEGRPRDRFAVLVDDAPRERFLGRILCERSASAVSCWTRCSRFTATSMC